jgi:hypothetical protein
MEEIILLADSVIHLEQGIVRQISTITFFQTDSGSSAITGDAVAIEEDINGASTVVLLNNRIIKINSAGNAVQVKVGDKVEIISKNNVALIRKL